MCPPARMAGYGVPFETWCAENGERGARLLAEYADTEKSAREVTKASNHKAPWNCRDCGHEWRARVDNRTKSGGKRNPTSGGKRNPTDCPACAGSVATETHNLKLFCDDSRGRLAHLPGEWNHRSKRMEDFTPASNEVVPWRCVKCGHEWKATIHNRTNSEHPSGGAGCTR